MAKMIKEKTGESYGSKAKMKKHEATESLSAMKKEYGSKTAMQKMKQRATSVKSKVKSKMKMRAKK